MNASMLLVALLAAADPITVPPDFTATLVAEGITGATAMEVAPDGRIFICEQTGALRVLKRDRLLPAPFVTLKVDSAWERGLIGVACDPDFARNRYLYLCYTPPDPYPHHRISRFTADGDVAAGEEVVLFEGDDQTKLGGEVPTGHQGGAIHFGKDGKLYVALGEQTAGIPAQRMDSLLGKMLRLNPDGSIPDDNPFAGSTKGKYRAIWALGLRNPFTFAVQPKTGRLFINDVGGVKEEINEGFAGANYGWPTIEHGPTADPRFRGPIHCYPTNSITGGTFHGPPPDDESWTQDPAATGNRFPPEYRGRYFFLDFTKGWIKTLDPAHPEDVDDFAAGLARPVDLRFAPDGSLYTLERDAWVKDQDFRPKTGRMHKIEYKPADPSHPRPGRPALARDFPAPRPLPPISPPGGKFTGPIEVRLNLARPDKATRYTLDGSPPTASSPRYSAPIKIDASATIRARNFQGESPAGAEATSTFEIGGTTPYGLTGRVAVGGLRVTRSPSDLPSRLSETGVFTSLVDLTPSAGIIPYGVNSPLWSDGAAKRRWIALPGGEPAAFSKAGEWSFPVGTVFIKHFELPIDEANPASVKRLETRLLVVTGEARGYGVTYKWRPDRSDADLVPDTGAAEDTLIKTSQGERAQTWSFPSRDECLKCHTTNAGFVLGARTQQLNGPYRYPTTGVIDNQLRTWNALGMLRPRLSEEDIPRMPRLVSPDDATASLPDRVRSYLDANCMHCHRPGANIPAAFDARYEVAESDRHLMNAPNVSDALGIDRPRIIAPGDPARSLLYQRMIRPDRNGMPPLARNVIDASAAALVREWIEGITSVEAAKRAN